MRSTETPPKAPVLRTFRPNSRFDFYRRFAAMRLFQTFRTPLARTPTTKKNKNPHLQSASGGFQFQASGNQLHSKDRPAQISGRLSQFLLNAKQLVVFSDPVRAGGGAGFDLAGVECHCVISDYWTTAKVPAFDSTTESISICFCP